LIRIRNLWFRYDDSDEWVLKDINLSVECGEFIVLTGPNGSGKSTLARILVGLIPSFYKGELRGEVVVDGVSVCRNPDEAFRVVGYLGEDPEVQIVTLTVEDEVSFGPSNLGLSVAEVRRRVDWALKAVKGEYLRNRCTFELSIGETQKVSLASLLALKPRVLVLDEPSVFLDYESKDNLYKTLKSLTREGLTVITIEHTIHNVVQLADKLVVLDKGRIVWYGRVEYPKTRREGTLQNYRQQFNLDMGKSKLWRYRISKDSLDYTVSLENVWFRYPRSSNWVLRDVTINVYRGEAVGVLGPNGSGKSTLIKIAIGVLNPQYGRVSVLGVNPHREWRKLIGRVGYVPQNPTLSFTSSTVYRDLLETAIRLGVEYADERVREIVDLMGLWEYRDTPVLKLSYGFRRRLSIALALVGDPEILILDEPTAYLDVESRDSIIEVLRKLKGKTTIIIASHDEEFIGKVCDRVVVITNGVIRQECMVRE